MSFEPATITAILTAASAAVTGLSSLVAGNFRAAVAKQQAEIARLNADRATELGKVEQLKQEDLSLAFIGEQIATQSASGLSLGGSSQVLTRKTARRLARKDALNVRRAAEVERFNFLAQANASESEASLAKFEGVSGLLASFFEAAAGSADSLIGSSKSTKSALAKSPGIPKPKPLIR